VADVFIPIMAGFLLTRTLSGGSPASTAPGQPVAIPVYRPCRRGGDPEGCTSRSSGGGSGLGGGYYTGSGYRVSRSSSGSATLSRGAFGGSPATATTLSRGGFGVRAMAISARA
jgi:uncharacterized protein YgiB involved in biofilm formation